MGFYNTYRTWPEQIIGQGGTCPRLACQERTALRNHGSGNEFESQFHAFASEVNLWEGCRESRRCSRDTYPESYISPSMLVYEDKMWVPAPGCEFWPHARQSSSSLL